MSLKINNFAITAYGSNSAAMPSAIPRQKFNFFIQLDMLNAPTIAFDRVKDVTLPDYSFDTVILNQYNKKRVVQTRMNYSECQITFYDTFDSSFHGIMKNYIGHYYNGTGLDKRHTPIEVNTLNGKITTDMGYNQIHIADRYFFPEIRIIQPGYSQTFGVDKDVLQSHNRTTIMTNCVITSIRTDTLDYSASDPVTFTVSFQPEVVTVSDQTNDAGR